MQFALATPTRALLLPSQCFPQVRDRLRGVLTGHRRPRARDPARHCHIWYQFSNGTFFNGSSSNGSNSSSSSGSNNSSSSSSSGSSSSSHTASGGCEPELKTGWP